MLGFSATLTLQTLAVAVIFALSACSEQGQEADQQQDSPFRLAEGVEVNDLTGIEQGYELNQSEEGYYTFTVNVSAENMPHVFNELSGLVIGPGFIVFEIPTHEDEEKNLRQSESDPYHNDVYYLDGISWAKAKTIIDANTHLLFNDGMIHFGYGSHSGYDEVFVGQYKILTIYAEQPAKYQSALESLGIPRFDDLTTVWDNFTDDSPGKRFALTDLDKTIYEIVEELKAEGLYFAERRED